MKQIARMRNYFVPILIALAVTFLSDGIFLPFAVSFFSEFGLRPEEWGGPAAELVKAIFLNPKRIAGLLEAISIALGVTAGILAAIRMWKIAAINRELDAIEEQLDVNDSRIGRLEEIRRQLP
jgi:hypothetical protein